MSEFEKDPVVSFQSPKVGEWTDKKTNKTHPKYTLYLTPEDAALLSSHIIEKGEEKGLRLDLFLGEGSPKDKPNITFPKAFMFIKTKQDSGDFGPKVAKPKFSPEEIKAKLSAMKDANSK